MYVCVYVCACVVCVCVCVCMNIDPTIALNTTLKAKEIPAMYHHEGEKSVVCVCVRACVCVCAHLCACVCAHTCDHRQMLGGRMVGFRVSIYSSFCHWVRANL